MTTLRIVCCSAPEDKKLVESLRAHLRVLEIQQVSIWYAHEVSPGREWERERDSQLQSAHLILFLVSSDFLSSREQYETIVQPVMERYKRGEIHVIPIILRPVHWQETPFGKLQPLPKNGKPVTDPGWKTRDHAFVDVVCEMKRVIEYKKPHLLMLQKQGDFPFRSFEISPITCDAITLLERIIQDFKSLRGRITRIVFLQEPQGFRIENCERQYNGLYGDALVFLATYLPQTLSNSEQGFVEAVYRKAAIQLHQRNNAFVWLTRRVITPLATLERLAAQIDACVATLELIHSKL